MLAVLPTVPPETNAIRPDCTLQHTAVDISRRAGYLYGGQVLFDNKGLFHHRGVRTARK